MPAANTSAAAVPRHARGRPHAHPNPITLPEGTIREIWRQLRANPGAELTIDLPDQTVIAPDGSAHHFDISPLRNDRLTRGIDDIDVTLEYRACIDAFEARHRALIPWLPIATRE